jgi:O-antigen/teichoic acid export membrane protein
MKNIFETYLSKIILTIVTFITNIFIARAIGAEGIGNYALIVTSGVLLSAFFSFGLESSLLYFSSNNSDCRRELFHYSMIYVTFTSASLLLLYSFADSLGIYNNSNAYYIILVMTTYMLQSMIVSIKIGSGKLVKVNKTLIFCNLLCVLFVSFISSFLEVSYKSIVIAYVLVTGLTVLILISQFKVTSSKNSDNLVIKEIFQYAIKSYLANISGILRLRLPIIILASFVLSDQVGIYSVAQTFNESVYIFPVVLSSMIIPMLSNMDKNEQQDLALKYAKFSLFFSFILVIFINSLAFFFIIPIYGQEFADSVELLLIMSPSIIFFSISKILMAYFFGIKKPEYCSFSEFITMIISTGLLLIFTAKYGVQGTAVSVLLSSMLLCGVVMTIFAKKVDIELRVIFTIQKTDIKDIIKNLMK